MILHQPFHITSGLYPGIKIGEATLECREALRFVVYWPDGYEHKIEGFKPGACADLQSCFEAILSFLSAWVEALDYTDRTCKVSDNVDLFSTEDQRLMDWARNNSDEITMLSIELEEQDNLIE